MDTSRWAVSVPVGHLLREWEVVRPLETGSWGSVYEGRRGEQTAALKILPTGTLTPRQFSHLAAMTGREVRSYGKLAGHPRLIGLLETFTVDDPGRRDLDGATVIVMELADRSLAKSVGLGRPVPDAPRLIAEICEGLAYMHAEGWLHGDLKPSNILLMADGSVRLADFGLTTELDGSHAYLPRVGSMDYLAPERRNESMTIEGAAVRVSADIWALGVTAYQLLTGGFPFPGSTWRARSAAAVEYVEGRTPLVLDPELSEGWRDWISDCLAPTHRARSRHDARSLVERAQLLAAGRWRRRWSRRRRALVSATTATALTAAVIAVPMTIDGRFDPRTAGSRPSAGSPPAHSSAQPPPGVTASATGGRTGSSAGLTWLEDKLGLAFPAGWKVVRTPSGGTHVLSSARCPDAKVFFGSQCDGFWAVGADEIARGAEGFNSYDGKKPYYPTSDVEPCPVPGIGMQGTPKTPLRKYVPVGSGHTAAYTEWIVPCLDDNGEPTSGFTQQEWFLPSSQILIIDQTDTPGLPGLLNHASWH